MRVAIIVPGLSQTGPIKVIQTLVNSLYYEMEQVQIKLFYLDKNVDHNLKILVPVEKLDRKAFCFNDFDIIHTNGIRPDLFAFLNRRKIKYHISTIHNFVFEDLSFTYNKLFSLIFGNIWLALWKRPDKLVCVSETMSNYYEKWFPPFKLDVVYNGIPLPEKTIFCDSDIINRINDFRSIGLKVIGCAGILTRRKGIDQILNMLEKETAFALIIIGSGKELGNLQKLARKLNISERCYFSGFRSSAVNYFSYFDFFIIPSRSEGFGLTLIEAVQQNIPVICSDLAVFNELMNKEEVTFFKLENIPSLILALRETTISGSKKSVLAYARYLNSYTNTLMARNYLELYNSF